MRGRSGGDGEGDGELDCADFSTRGQAQSQLAQDPADLFNLDADDDGQACEEFFVRESASDRQYGEQEVIVKTIPKEKKLADTGGLRLSLLAGAALLSTGLLAGRSVIRAAASRLP